MCVVRAWCVVWKCVWSVYVVCMCGVCKCMVCVVWKCVWSVYVVCMCGVCKCMVLLCGSVCVWSVYVVCGVLCVEVCVGMCSVCCVVCAVCTSVRVCGVCVYMCHWQYVVQYIIIGSNTYYIHSKCRINIVTVKLNMYESTVF